MWTVDTHIDGVHVGAMETPSGEVVVMFPTTFHEPMTGSQIRLFCEKVAKWVVEQEARFKSLESDMEADQERLRDETRGQTLAFRILRAEVYRRDSGRCRYCGEFAKIEKYNVDHVTPRCLGGEDTLENLVTACWPCNRRKGSKTLEQSGMKLLEVGAFKNG